MAPTSNRSTTQSVAATAAASARAAPRALRDVCACRGGRWLALRVAFRAKFRLCAHAARARATMIVGRAEARRPAARGRPPKRRLGGSSSKPTGWPAASDRRCSPLLSSPFCSPRAAGELSDASRASRRIKWASRSDTTFTIMTPPSTQTSTSSVHSELVGPGGGLIGAASSAASLARCLLQVEIQRVCSLMQRREQ